MFKILETLINVLRNTAKIYSSPLYNMIQRGMDFKSFSMTMVAHYSRRLGARMILTVGVLATVYASYLFIMHTLTPDMPTASHDAILKTRFSSPKPSRDILIVDIDERTLALLSDKQGRWPWSRDVLADGLQKLNGLGARAVLFGVLLSDPDKTNADADAVMNMTAQMSRPTAFPLIRLNPKNDAQSQLKVIQIPGVQLKEKQHADTTISVILPMFGSMHDRLGVANQKPDADGIVRKYPLRWEEAKFILHSMVQRTAELAAVDITKVPNLISLNWRNKQGRYNRISFGDMYLDQLKPEQAQAFKGAFVVLSLSAPGLGQTKPTSVASVEDDGEILATALDDAIYSTYLRTMPNIVALFINLLTIWVLVWMSLKQKINGFLNKAFVLVQSGLGGITLLSASYTYYLIDLSSSMTFGLSVFAAIKLVHTMDDRWSRARLGYRKGNQIQSKGRLFLLSYLNNHVIASLAETLQSAAERIVGFSNVVRVDDLFGGESFVKSHCERFKCILVNVEEDKSDQVIALLQQPEYAAVDLWSCNMVNTWNPENKVFATEVAPLILTRGGKMLQDELAAQYAQ